MEQPWNLKDFIRDCRETAIGTLKKAGTHGLLPSHWMSVSVSPQGDQFVFAPAAADTANIRALKKDDLILGRGGGHPASQEIP